MSEALIFIALISQCRFSESMLGISLGDTLPNSVVITTASFAILIGLVVFVLNRSFDRSKEINSLVFRKSLSVKDEEDEYEVLGGKPKVTIFYKVQTGIAEAFAE
ncbi:hypothetical protein SADUNF_Sadunf17G0065300 [Salix dunnii]|uniref:Flavodoxin-like domain-containing protein n=1 Tax=Salix dunnii TaxID=1413687 RepID=A0A835J5R8_9ROSI|nr:hypothetical protein SADUNF_Sadunf17G0065300 [Salix dunnii]